jgi:hypothetical protein
MARDLEGVHVNHNASAFLTGWHWVDLKVNGAAACIIWRESSGFGVSLPQADDTPFDAVDVDAPGWRRAKTPAQALCLALVLLLRKQGNPSP